MKISRLLMLVAVVALFAGCGSSLELNNDFDQQLDFSTYRTFQWVDPSDKAGQGANNSLIAGRVKDAVVNELTGKGLVQAASDPDFLVIYHAGTQDKVDISDYGYSYGGYGRYGGAYGGPYGAGGGGISTYNYTEGTLIIDLIDAGTQQLAWRGSATGVLDDNPSAEQITSNINKAVAAILSQYPPRK